MVELSQCHLSPDVFTHGDQSNTENGKRLECIVRLDFLLGILALLLVFLLPVLLLCNTDVLVTIVQHGLHLQDISSTGERASLHQYLCSLGDRMFDRFQRFDRRIRGIL